MKILDSLYYTLYRFSLRTTLKDIGEHVGYMWVSVFLLTNIVVIAKNAGINILQYTSTKASAAILGGGMMVLFYFVYVRSKRFIALTEKYKEETNKQKSIRITLVLVYIIATFVALLLF